VRFVTPKVLRGWDLRTVLRSQPLGRLGHVLRHTVRAAQRRVLTLGPRPLPTVLFGSEAATGLRRRHVGSSGQGAGAQRPQPLQHPYWPAGGRSALQQQPCSSRQPIGDRLWIGCENEVKLPRQGCRSMLYLP
jgi:hypothetical protein